MLPFLLSRLRRQDLIASVRPDVFVANSRHVAARIRKYYRREAHVIHPPVDGGPFLEDRRAPRTGTTSFSEGWWPTSGRTSPSQACTLLDRPLKVVGGGRAAEELKTRSGSSVEWLGELDDAELPGLIAGARALLFPGEEDFGIVPVEAQAAGLPVIAYGVGGVCDSVIDGVTGVFFDEQTPTAMAAAIEEFERLTFHESDIRANAQQFTAERFRTEMARLLLDLPVNATVS